MFQDIKKSLCGGDSANALSEAVKAQRRRIARSIRSLERQHQKAELEEQKLFNQLKTQATNGRIDTLQTKQLIVLRRRRGAILRCKAQLGAADLQVQQQQATQELHRHFRGCAKLLSLANKAADLQTMQLAVKGFTRESLKLGLVDEMLNEVLEDGTAQFEDEAETEEQILQELVECANSEIDRQLPQREVSCPSAVREVPRLGQQESLQQHQQLPGRKHKKLLLQKLSNNPRSSRAPWLRLKAQGLLLRGVWTAAKDEAAIAEHLEQRLGSLLR